MIPDTTDENDIRGIKKEGKCPKCHKKHAVKQVAESGAGPLAPDGIHREMKILWFRCSKDKGGCGRTFSINKRRFESI